MRRGILSSSIRYMRLANYRRTTVLETIIVSRSIILLRGPYNQIIVDATGTNLISSRQVRLIKSKVSVPVVLHLEKPRPYIIMEESSVANFKGKDKRL